MRKTGLRVGISLVILSICIVIACLSLPSLINNRVNLKEAMFGLIPASVLFLLGFIFTVLSLIFTSRAKKVAAIYKAQLGEAIATEQFFTIFA